MAFSLLFSLIAIYFLSKFDGQAFQRGRQRRLGFGILW